MNWTARWLAVLVVVIAAFLCFGVRDRAPASDIAPEPTPKAADPILSASAISALLEANDGKPPATGEQLRKALSKLGKFTQLPVVFSAVKLDSGIAHPRVVITPFITSLSAAEVTQTNLNGRLFLAANMEKGAKGGDPYVASVEFISWNSMRRQFDFGVIDNMGETEDPQFRIVDGGRCFSCHKNKGPILGANPWSNTTSVPGIQSLIEKKFNLVPVLPAAPPPGVRDRIDGMALAAADAVAVDVAVRLGALLRLNRDTFRLMVRSETGRKAFVEMLITIVEPGASGPNEKEAKRLLENWGNEQSYVRFTADWIALNKATNTGILADFTPFQTVQRDAWQSQTIKPVPTAPPGGFTSAAAAKAHETKVNLVLAENESVRQRIAKQTELIAAYDATRAEGHPGLASHALPSNPKAFVQPAVKITQKPSGMVNPVMLAATIGLTDGDRRFLSESLANAVERIKKPKIATSTIARAIFEGPEFADVLKGETFPDRDEFKDRFVAGLHKYLMAKYPDTKGFTPDRSNYASGPRYDRSLALEKEAEVVPTSACLRCHDVRASGKARVFESIPALAFDPFDKVNREVWVKTPDKERKRQVLSRMLDRLVKDADMPPHDSPEHTLFRVKEAAAFAEVKDFLAAELDKLKTP
jgi:hypothetical protein